jgi:ABC-type Fe3+-siderophore transport system permease subunit
MDDKQMSKLLIIPVLIYVFSRATLELLPPNDGSIGHTLMWLVLMVAPFVAFIVIYFVARSRLGKKVSPGRLVLFSVAVGLLIAVLTGQKTIVTWLFRLEKEDTLLSRSLVGLLVAWHGWLFPLLVLVIFFSFVLLKWRRTS